MGYGSYKASDWAKLKQSRGISSTSGASEIFKGNQLQDKYNPKFISVRESRDSDDSPNSTPIILAFDVTGSMGYLAAEIAKNSLNKTAVELYDKRPVPDPHIMCAAITCPSADGGLQVTQFEADIRVVEQLLDLRVGFGGNMFSYDSLVWYFAAKHTSIDCFEKRGKKGFLFTIGDEICGDRRGETLSSNEIKAVFDDNVSADLPLRDVYNMAAEKYEIFHIVADRYSSFEGWDAFMPGRVAYIAGSDIAYLSEVITSIMQVANGMDKTLVIQQWAEDVQDTVKRAIANINLDEQPKKVEVPQPKKAEAPQDEKVDEPKEKIEGDKNESSISRWKKFWGRR